MTWTRDHDRIIAERCDGLTVRRWDELPISQQNYDYCPDELFVGDSIHAKLPDYSTDLVACVRAAEAWRLKDPSKRRYSIDSPWAPGDTFDAQCRADIDTKCNGEADTACAALAWALIEAVKDRA